MLVRLNKFIKHNLHYKKSIQAKMFLSLVVLSLVAVVIVTVITNYVSARTIRNYAQVLTVNNLANSNNNMELILEDMDKTGFIIANNRSAILDVLVNDEMTQEKKKEEITSFIESIYRYKPFIYGITITDAYDNQYSLGHSFDYDFVKKEKWYYDSITNQSKTIFSNAQFPNYNYVDGVKFVYSKRLNLLVASKGIFDGEKAIGVVIIYFKYDIIERNFEEIDNGEGFILTFDENNQLIYKSKTINDIFINNNVIKYFEDNNYFDKGFEENENSSIIAEIENEKYVITKYKSDYTGWTTFALTPEKFLTKDFHQLRNILLLVVIIILILLFITSNVISGRMTKNLKELSFSMDKVGQGYLNVIPNVESQDEIGNLAKGFISMVERLQQLMIDIKIKEKQKRELEFKSLQSQIKPHFLYNTLNTIRYLATLHSANNIEDVTSSLINLLRLTVSKSDVFITIEEEIQHVKNYINIQQYKYIDKFHVNWQVEEDILCCKSLKLILQPIVENSIFHGIEPLEHKGLISIKIYKDSEKTIKFVVYDNGVGIDKDDLQNILKGEKEVHKAGFTSIGINNIDQRIKLYFGEEYGVDIYSEKGVYTSVDLTIPLMEE